MIRSSFLSVNLRNNPFSLKLLSHPFAQYLCLGEKMLVINNTKPLSIRSFHQLAAGRVWLLRKSKLNNSGNASHVSRAAFTTFIKFRKEPAGWLRHKLEIISSYRFTTSRSSYYGGSGPLTVFPKISPNLSPKITQNGHLNMGNGTSKARTITSTSSKDQRQQVASSSNNMGSNLYFREPKNNQGLTLTLKERDNLGLRGLLPPAVRTLEEQIEAVVKNLDRFDDDLSRYLHLRHLQDYDEHLFYCVMGKYTEKLMPIVYTPTVGQACIDYSLLYFRPRGLFISIEDKGKVYDILGNWPEKEIKAIVVTDGERILGLGDQGANGMGIPVGKLSLYTALAGFPPHLTLPVTLDTGTNNKDHRADPFYIGLKRDRVRGSEYDEFIDEFMKASVKRFGRSCLIQFEDFGNSNAFRLLEKYKNSYCTFNDDIQGTASVAVAGVFASLRLTGQKLSQNTFLFIGAGEAALGTADLLVMAMMEEGLTSEEAHNKIWLADSRGLILKGRPEGFIDAHKEKYAKEHSPIKDIEKMLELIRPSAIIGVSAQGGLFTPRVLNMMTEYSERPLIFALSNPTSKAECTAEAAYINTKGRCIFASGSPFDPVTYENKTFYPGQGNNAYIFPGVGLAVMACGVQTIPDQAFLIAARDLAEQVNQGDLEEGRVYPPLSDIFDVSVKIAKKLAQYFFSQGLATVPEPKDLDKFLHDSQYKPF